MELLLGFSRLLLIGSKVTSYQCKIMGSLRGLMALIFDWFSTNLMPVTDKNRLRNLVLD
jgi:hypothetical protein